MNHLFIVFISLSALALVSCASNKGQTIKIESEADLAGLRVCTVTTKINSANDYYSAYGGKSYSYIVNVWGAPNRVESDGQGGQILIYESFTQSTSGSIYNNGSNTSDIRANTLATRHYAEFYISSDDTCYKVRTNHMQDGGKKISWLKTGLLAALGTPIAYIVYIMLAPKN